MSVEDAARILAEAEEQRIISSDRLIEPLLSEGSYFEPLTSILKDLALDEERANEVAREFALLANAALIFFGVPFYEYSEVIFLLEKIRGAINIGLVRAASLSQLSLPEICDRLGFSGLYRLGLTEVLRAKLTAEGLPRAGVDANVDDLPAQAVLAAARQSFPCLPVFFRSDGSFSSVEGEMSGGMRTFSQPQDVELVCSFLKKRFGA